MNVRIVSVDFDYISFVTRIDEEEAKHPEIRR